MNTIIPVGSALLGAVVAGVISYLAGKGMKTHEWRLALARENIAARRRLYAEFLGEADRLILLSLDKKRINEIVGFKELTTKLVEISLLSSDEILDSAKSIADYTLTSHTKDAVHDPEVEYHSLKEKFVSEVRKELSTYEQI